MPLAVPLWSNEYWRFREPVIRIAAMDISGLLRPEHIHRTHATVTYCIRTRDGEKEHVVIKFQHVPLDRSGRPINPAAPWMAFGRTTTHTRGAPAL